MITVKRYTQKDESGWNTFVDRSANGTFILNRRYMDYHRDRFADHSLLLYQNQKCIGVFPANEEKKHIFSHGGLTYGGLIVGPDTKLAATLTCIHGVLKYYNQKGFTTMSYKPVPTFFHTTPYMQDLYALFIAKSTCMAFNAGFAMDVSHVTVPKNGRYMIAKAQRNTVQIVRASTCRAFWSEILVPHLAKKFHAAPVHTMEEIERLRKQFPANILQYHAVLGGTIVAGATIYKDRGVAHCQYIASSDTGRKTGANDYLMWYLITREFTNLRYVSFGTAISPGLIRWKEGFGAIMYPYPCYAVETKNYTMLEKYL